MSWAVRTDELTTGACVSARVCGTVNNKCQTQQFPHLHIGVQSRRRVAVCRVGCGRAGGQVDVGGSRFTGRIREVSLDRSLGANGERGVHCRRGQAGLHGGLQSVVWTLFLPPKYFRGWETRLKNQVRRVFGEVNEHGGVGIKEVKVPPLILPQDVHLHQQHHFSLTR